MNYDNFEQVAKKLDGLDDLTEKAKEFLDTELLQLSSGDLTALFSKVNTVGTEISNAATSVRNIKTTLSNIENNVKNGG